MRKILLSVLMTAVCSLGFAANIAVGYCDGQLAETSSYNVKGKGVVSAAVRFTPEVLSKYVGNEIRAVNAGLVSVKYCDSLVVWVRESLDGDDLARGVIKRGGTQVPKVGWNVVTLEQSLAIEAGKTYYVGYSYGQRYNEATVSVVGAPVSETTFIKRGAAATWEDISADGVGSIEALVGGDNMPQVDLALVKSVGIQPTPGVLNVTTSIANRGQIALTDYDLTFSADGYSYTYTASTAVASGTTGEVSVVLYDVPQGVGFEKDLTVTLSRVTGGEDYSTDDNSLLVSVKVKRNVVVEEFTGTGCGWCPRGLVGMDLMHETYGLGFVGIAIHQYNSTDPMYPTRYKNIGLNAAPSCKIDRDFECDPYYGTGNTDRQILNDFEAEMNKGAFVIVNVDATWDNPSDPSGVVATIKVTAQDNIPGAQLGIVLLADSLRGTTNDWKQSNYYASNYTASQLPPDLALFGSGGSLGQSSFFWDFNDVAIGTYYENGQYEMSLGDLTKGENQTISYELSFPTKEKLRNALKLNCIAVAAFVMGNDGKILNAGKFYVPETTGIRDISKTADGNLREVARYTLDGRMLSTPQKGVNVVRLSDGSTVKVLVK